MLICSNETHLDTCLAQSHADRKELSRHPQGTLYMSKFCIFKQSKDCRLRFNERLFLKLKERLHVSFLALKQLQKLCVKFKHLQVCVFFASNFLTINYSQNKENLPKTNVIQYSQLYNCVKQTLVFLKTLYIFLAQYIQNQKTFVKSLF